MDVDIPINEKRKQAIFEYVCFVADSSPEERADTEKFDRRRKALHEKICAAYQDERCFSGADLNKIRSQLYTFGYLDEMLKDKAAFPTLDDIVEYVYWYNEDIVKNHWQFYNRVETEYHAKLWIERVTAKFKAAVEIKIAQCDNVLDAYQKACDTWNADKEYGSELYCNKTFDHERNNQVGRIRDAFKTIDVFAKFPIDAYLKKTVKEYYYDQVDIVNEAVSKLRANAFYCLMYWKHETKFWDPKFDL